MKKAFITFSIFLAVIGLVMALIYIFMLAYDYKSEQKRIKVNYALTEEEINLIQDGDVILRHGYGLVSDLITETLAEEVSHCAILVKDSSGINVIHSVSQSLSDYDGVQMQNLKRFINDSKKNSVVVMRYKFSENDDKSLIGKKARSYLDKKIPFDNNFDINDSSQFFCSELLWKVFLDAYGADVLKNKYDKGNNELLKFDVFFNPEFFEPVFSHHPIKTDSL